MDCSVPVTRAGFIVYDVKLNGNMQRHLRSMGYLVDWNSVDALNFKSLWVSAKLGAPFSPRVEGRQ